MKNPKSIFIVIAALAVVGLFMFLKSAKPSDTRMQTKEEDQTTIKYVPVGDSYTIGLGVEEGERWPNLMVEHLKGKGYNIRLLENPAVSGFTVRDAIEVEVPVVERLKPDFVTVFIGANDNFSRTTVGEFSNDLKILLDKLQKTLEKSGNIVMITLPDYAKAPGVRGGGELSGFIEEYNRVIKDEAGRRGLKTADIYPASQKMTGSEDYIEDGLHPSALGYTKWEKEILPVVIDLLNGR